MPEKVRIALDAMGGDHGASVVISGAALSLTRHPGTEFLLFGDQAVITPLLAAHPALREACRVVHTDVAVKMDDKPSQALRAWPLEIVDVARARRGQEGRGGRRRLGRQYRRADGHGEIQSQDHGRDRAAGDRRRCGRRCAARSIVLDVGATIGADAQHLVDMAVMGAPWRASCSISSGRRSALLNIGVEEVKGLEEVREAGRILREARSAGYGISRFRRGQRHRQGHGRRGGDGRLCRQHRAQDRRKAPPARSPHICAAP